MNQPQTIDTLINQLTLLKQQNNGDGSVPIVVQNNERFGSDTKPCTQVRAFQQGCGFIVYIY